MPLDNVVVRTAKHGALARLLLFALDLQSSIEITMQILDPIREESLSPTVVSTWLTVSKYG